MTDEWVRLSLLADNQAASIVYHAPAQEASLPHQGSTASGPDHDNNT
ncbi:hypothetical protein [Pseudomonas fluorescens]|nr:hypothetical protein [Pseudomonas fluorescens]